MTEIFTKIRRCPAREQNILATIGDLEHRAPSRDLFEIDNAGCFQRD
jgi:hypothetical protein